MARNVLGGELAECGRDPITGFFHGCCNTSPDDVGSHTVCATVTAEFLEYSKAAGNDLSTPRPEYGFVGLKPGDGWCVRAARWLQAAEAGYPCPVRLAATHERALDVVPLELLRTHVPTATTESVRDALRGRALVRGDDMTTAGFDSQRLARVAALVDRYVAEGKLAGAQVQVAHRGEVALRHTVGRADVASDRPLGDDAIYRIYSMTKPITSIALMQLYEQGRVLLEDPVSAYIPEFAEMQVFTGGTPTGRRSARRRPS